MDRNNLIICLLVLLILLKLLYRNENYDLIQEKCVTITNPIECKMSGCEIGKNNTCVTPRTGVSYQTEIVSSEQNINKLKELIRNQNINSRIASGHLRKSDLQSVQQSPQTGLTSTIPEPKEHSGQKQTESGVPSYSPQQKVQRVRESTHRRSRSFNR